MIKVFTYRGVANGWQLRATRSAASADRLVILLNRIQPQLIHKVTG
jgi:hypothetical protein